MDNSGGRMPFSDLVEDSLVSSMQAELTRPPWWRTWWGRTSVALGSLTLVASAGVAAMVVFKPAPVTDFTTVHCLDSPRRNLDGTLPGVTAGLASPDGVVLIDDARSFCSDVWRSGAFESESTDPLDPNPPAGHVPEELTVCTTDEGEAAVIPGRVDCSVLRLHPAQP